MKPYLVVSIVGDEVGLEDLSMENRDKKLQIKVTKTDENTLLNSKGETAKILKILPENFNLSGINDGNGHLVYDSTKKTLLYDLMPLFKDYPKDKPLEWKSIVGISDWETK